MAHIGVMCPNVPGHLNPTTALADALRSRGHRVTFFLLGDPPASVSAAGFEVVQLGGSVFPPDEYRADFKRLGTLNGRAALKHTLALGARATEAILQVGPALVRKAGVTALLVDQSSFSGGTIADQLALPFATVCNALLLNPDPAVPPFFTSWQPREDWWAWLRNRVAWAALNGLYSPILTRIQAERHRLGLSAPRQIADTWSSRLQVSQQPAALEFPRPKLPEEVKFVGPLRLPGGYAPVPFPWERLDGRPLIYASLGTLQNRVAGTFQVIAEACSGLDAQLVISTGNGVAPKALGDLPGRPVVVPYAPQLELLRRAALAVTHAGLNTVLDALSAGVPIVAIPVTNEQPGIAARIGWAGAGEAITLKQATPDRLRSLIGKVRQDPAYRSAAEQIRDSMRSSGGAPRAAELIERGLALSASS
jgi:zeaxanthin glucosyltransferase